MALGKDKGKIILRGGGVLKVNEVSDAGAATTTAVSDLGFINETGLLYEKPMEDVRDETGDIVASLPGDANIKLSGMFMQSDAELIEFLRDSTEGKFYSVYYKSSRTAQMDGKTQEFFFGIGTFKPMIDVKAGTKRIPFEITLLNNETTITLSTTQLAALGSIRTTAVTIDAGKYFEVTET